MNRLARIALLFAPLALASCARTYTPRWHPAWTPATAKAAIVEVQREILRERMHPTRGIGYQTGFAAKDFAAADQHFTTEGLPAPHTSYAYLTGPQKINYSSIDRVLIVPNRINAPLPTVLTLGLVGPHWGRTLCLALKEDSRAVCLADVRGCRDWWKNVFPLWAFHPNGPRWSDAHRLGAAIDYMVAHSRPAAPPPAKKKP